MHNGTQSILLIGNNKQSYIKLFTMSAYKDYFKKPILQSTADTSEANQIQIEEDLEDLQEISFDLEKDFDQWMKEGPQLIEESFSNQSTNLSCQTIEIQKPSCIIDLLHQPMEIEKPSYIQHQKILSPSNLIKKYRLTGIPDINTKNISKFFIRILRDHLTGLDYNYYRQTIEYLNSNLKSKSVGMKWLQSLFGVENQRHQQFRKLMQQALAKCSLLDILQNGQIKDKVKYMHYSKIFMARLNDPVIISNLKL